MKVLGIDPSLRNFGFAVGEVDIVTNELDILSIDLCETEGDTKNKTVRKNSDDLRRCRDIYNALHRNLKGVSVAFVEVPVGSQSSRAMASYGFCIGIMASVQIPVIQLTPSEVKIAATGDKNASKRDMIDFATGAYPNLNWYKGKGGYGLKNEHPADAVASILAGMKTDEYRFAVSMMNVALAA